MLWTKYVHPAGHRRILCRQKRMVVGIHWSAFLKASKNQFLRKKTPHKYNCTISCPCHCFSYLDLRLFIRSSHRYCPIAQVKLDQRFHDLPQSLCNPENARTPMLLVYQAGHPALICKMPKKKEQKRARGGLFQSTSKYFHSMACPVTVSEVSKKYTFFSLKSLTTCF